MDSTPNSYQSGDPISFLTSDHIKLIEQVIHESSQHINEYQSANYAIYWAMTSRDRTNFRIAVFKGKLNAAFKGQDNITIRTDNGGFYVIFGEDGLLHVKKLSRKTLLAWIPHALKGKPSERQLPLPEFMTPDNIPLTELNCFIVGLVENKLGELEAVYLSQQEGDVVTNRIPLEIDTTIPFSSPEAQDVGIPIVKFNAKKDNKDTGTT